MIQKSSSIGWDEGSVITFDGVVWGMPPELTWNQAFLMESILLLPDACTLTRLKYWAICKPSMRTMHHILDLTIKHNMKFHMATKIVDLTLVLTIFYHITKAYPMKALCCIASTFSLATFHCIL